MEETEIVATEATGEQPEVITPQQTSTAPKRDYEAAAKALGWSSKEAYQGDPEKWVDAKEFVTAEARSEGLYQEISKVRKENKKLHKDIEAVIKFQNLAVETAVKKAVSDLKSKRQEAIELGDVAAVDAIDDQILEVKAQLPTPGAPKLDSELTDWLAEDRNKWFHTNEEMRELAISINESYLKKHPGNLAESLAHTENMVKRAFPEAFNIEKKPAVAAVEGSSAASQQGRGKYSTSKLSPEMKMAYDQIVVKHKQLSHDEYFKSLEEAGYL